MQGYGVNDETHAHTSSHSVDVNAVDYTDYTWYVNVDKHCSDEYTHTHTNTNNSSRARSSLLLLPKIKQG